MCPAEVRLTQYTSVKSHFYSNQLIGMSGSGKSLLGLWLYRTGEDWTLREATQTDVRFYLKYLKIWLAFLNIFLKKSFAFSAQTGEQSTTDRRDEIRFQELCNILAKKPSRWACPSFASISSKWILFESTSDTGSHLILFEQNRNRFICLQLNIKACYSPWISAKLSFEGTPL